MFYSLEIASEDQAESVALAETAGVGSMMV
jgi:hypothetical protein